jgi:hypothetical protein
MPYLDVVVECRCVSSTDVFFLDSCRSCVDVACVFSACMYMIAGHSSRAV